MPDALTDPPNGAVPTVAPSPPCAGGRPGAAALGRTVRWIGLAVGLLAAALVALSSPAQLEGLLALVPGGADAAPDPQRAESVRAETASRVRRLEADLRAHLPGRAYLVVSTSDNRIFLHGPSGLLHEGICSTGSYVHLVGQDGREWTFKTPRGAFRVLKKTKNPVWTKPDWAFVEEGRPVPPPGSPERRERGVLGRYSLALGDGYLIHGTLYQRLLGMPVTHGCVRLGDEDLELVFRTLAVGAPVYIY